MDYGKNTKKLELVEDTITKAKALLQELGKNSGMELDEPLLGEEVKVKRPSKNPKEEKITMEKDASKAYAGDTNEG